MTSQVLNIYSINSEQNLNYIPILMFVYLTEKITQTVSVTKTAVEIVENEVKLKLTIVDTPGFGDALNNSKRYLKWCPNFHITLF